MTEISRGGREPDKRLPIVPPDEAKEVIEADEEFRRYLEQDREMPPEKAMEETVKERVYKP